MKQIKLIALVFAVLLGLSITTSVFAAPGFNPKNAETTTPTVEPTDEGHQVPQAIADFFGVNIEDILDWHAKGYGYGEIVKAYALKNETGKTVDEIFGLLAQGKGWGEIIKDLGLKPGSLEPNLGKVINASKPDKDNDNDHDPPGKGGDHKPDDKGNNDKGKGKNK